jgi:tryptophanyl-tRNA synthetase
MFHFLESDEQLEEVYNGCITGARLCGPCKAMAAEIVAEYLREHQHMREKTLPLAEEILKTQPLPEIPPR